MRPEIVPFNARFAEAAATLLATRTSLAELDITRAGPALAALHDGVLIGFMAATVTGFPGSPRARVRLRHHAADPANTRAIYRHLYQELSRRLVAIGCFEHSIVVAGHGDVFVELGFGIDQVKGARDLMSPGASSAVRLRTATADDLPLLLRLTLELQHFHADPPVLRPALIDLDAIGGDLLAAIADPARLVLLAEVDDHPVGLMVADPDSHLPGTATIGIAVVTAAARAGGVGTTLLSGVLDWAARRGFRACAAEWSSANLVSDAFWRGHGFTPVRHTLARHIDPRVAWADSQLSYPGF